MAIWADNRIVHWLSTAYFDNSMFIKQEAEKPPVKWMNNSRPVKRRYERYENEIKK